MNVQQIVGLKVVDKEHGTTAGHVTGLLIDAEHKNVIALAVGDNRRGVRYLPFGDVVSLGPDVVVIESTGVFLERGRYRAAGVLDSLEGRTVMTESGRILGRVQSYDIDDQGAIQILRFGVDTSAFGGLWKKPGVRHEIPGAVIKTIGEHILVDNSVGDMMEHERAA